MEKMSVDLKGLLFVEKKKMNEEESSKIDYKWKFRITLNILKGIQDLHEMNFVHCDIKLQNILLDHTYSVAKLGDFGLSKALNT